VTLSVEDRLDSLDLVSRADTAASRRDVDGYVDLFTADAVLDGAQGTHSGTAQLRSAVATVWGREPAQSVHLTLNPLIEPDGSDASAVVRSYLMVVQPGEPPRPITVAAITHHVSNLDGRWLITRRTVTLLSSDAAAP
jgi:hypothetical protein